MVRIVALVLMASAALLIALPASAIGNSSVPPGNSELDQYLPSIPGAGGDRRLGGGGGGNGAALPPSTAATLREAGPDGEAVLAVAEQTAPGSGHAAAPGGGSSPGGPDASGDQSVPGAVLSALGYGGGGGMGILLPIILGAVAGAGAYFVLRRRARAQG